MRQPFSWIPGPDDPEGIVIRICVDVLTAKGTISNGASILCPMTAPYGSAVNEGCELLRDLKEEAIVKAQQKKIL